MMVAAIASIQADFLQALAQRLLGV